MHSTKTAMLNTIRSAIFVCAAVALLPQVVRADVTANALGSLKYRALGPAIAGGRTTAIAGSDRDPSVYYAGGAGGGVFKTTDGGASWTPVFDREQVAPVGALAVNARDARDVWVGTGEANPRNDVEAGAGIWHSHDGGKTWSHAGLAGAASISAISLDPRDPRTVVVGVLGHVFRDARTRGVFITHDAGATWRRSLYLGPASGASDLARVPDRPGTLFAGMWEFRRTPWRMTSGGPLGGLYRSDDGGETWRKLSGHGLPAGATGRIGIAAGTAGRIYALVQAKAGNIWRSSDGGASWQVIPHSAYVGARPFYFSHLFVDPANRNRVVVVSLILSESDDGARSFHRIATNGGWDYHFVWWSYDGRRLAVASDEGVVMSSDGARNWHQPYDLPFAQPYHVGYDRTVPSYRVCVGLQDDNSWCAPSSADNGIGVLNRDWYQVGPGDGMWAVFDPQDSHDVWTTSTNSDTGQIYLYDERTRQAHEVSPDATNSEVVPATLRHRFNWDTPIAFANDGRVLAGGNVVFATTDRGAHWQVISPDLTRNEKSHQQVSGGPIDQDASGAEMSDTILQIAPSKLPGGPIWVGTDDGLVQLTRDGGASWQNVTPHAMPEWGRVYTIEPGHASPATAYVAVDHHMLGDDRPYLFTTNDYGATWSSISGDLPKNLFVRSVREDPHFPNLLFAGTRRGVFVSFDRGTHWHSLRLNMPATAIYDLQIQPDADDLIVAAHGRGVWILDDIGPLRAWAGGATQNAAYPARPAYRMWRAAPVNTFLNSSVPDNEFVGGDRPYGAIFTYYLARPAKHVAIEIADASGRIVKHYAGKAVTGHTGMNRAVWDLSEDGPVRWRGTFEQNRGPESGAEAVPGTYAVRTIVDGAVLEQPLTIVADPRDTATPEQAAQRHAFLSELNTELSGVDTMLNSLDARLRHGTKATGAPLVAMRAELTLDPRNIEDLRTPARLRERLMDLLSRVGSTSFQAPTEPQLAEAAALRDAYASASAAYRRL